MSWNQIGDDTFCYRAATNIGFCRGLVIEGGDKKHSVPAAESMADAGLQPKWLLNTHAHPDHFGGDHLFTALGAELLATREQKPDIEQDELGSLFSYGAVTSQREYTAPEHMKARPLDVDHIIRPGILDLDGARFTLEEHFGHNNDQISITTPDGVAFLGDILTPEKTLQFFKLIQIISVKDALADIDAVEHMDAKLFVPAHGDAIDDPVRLCALNRARIMEIIGIALDSCAEPLCKEQVVARVLSRLGVANPQFGNFFMTRVTVGAVLAYLVDENLVDPFIDENCLLVYRRA